MKKTFFLGLFAAGALCLQPALAQAPSSSGGGAAGSQQSAQRPSSMDQPGMNSPQDSVSKKADDKKFARDAAMGGMMEVALGKVAVQNASSEDVKKFGQKMVDDHSAADDKLKEVASKDNNMQLPDSLDSKHQAMVDKMSKLNGAAFDKAYVKAMLKDHKEDVSDFQTEAQSGTDPNLKAFASSTLPTLQQHLEMVKTLSKSEKGGSKMAAGGQ